jgi:hypothetical protein
MGLQSRIRMAYKADATFRLEAIACDLKLEDVCAEVLRGEGSIDIQSQNREFVTLHRGLDV